MIIWIGESRSMDDLFANNEEQEDVLFGNLEYDDQNIFSDDHSMFTEIDSDYNRIRKKKKDDFSKFYDENFKTKKKLLSFFRA